MREAGAGTATHGARPGRAAAGAGPAPRAPWAGSTACAGSGTPCRARHPVGALRVMRAGAFCWRPILARAHGGSAHGIRVLPSPSPGSSTLGPSGMQAPWLWGAAGAWHLVIKSSGVDGPRRLQEGCGFEGAARRSFGPPPPGSAGHWPRHSGQRGLLAARSPSQGELWGPQGPQSAVGPVLRGGGPEAPGRCTEQQSPEHRGLGSGCAEGCGQAGPREGTTGQAVPRPAKPALVPGEKQEVGRHAGGAWGRQEQRAASRRPCRDGCGPCCGRTGPGWTPPAASAPAASAPQGAPTPLQLAPSTTRRAALPCNFHRPRCQSGWRCPFLCRVPGVGRHGQAAPRGGRGPPALGQRWQVFAKPLIWGLPLPLLLPRSPDVVWTGHCSPGSEQGAVGRPARRASLTHCLGPGRDRAWR